MQARHQGQVSLSTSSELAQFSQLAECQPNRTEQGFSSFQTCLLLFQLNDVRLLAAACNRNSSTNPHRFGRGPKHSCHPSDNVVPTTTPFSPLFERSFHSHLVDPSNWL